MYQDKTLRIRTKLKIGYELQLEKIRNKAIKEVAKIKFEDDIKHLEFLASITFDRFYQFEDINDNLLLQECAYNLDAFYLVKRLRICADALYIANASNIAPPNSIIKGIPHIQKMSYIFDNPSIQILNLIVVFFQEPKLLNYQNLKAGFLEKIDKLGSLKNCIYVYC